MNILFNDRLLNVVVNFQPKEEEVGIMSDSFEVEQVWCYGVNITDDYDDVDWEEIEALALEEYKKEKGSQEVDAYLSNKTIFFV